MSKVNGRVDSPPFSALQCPHSKPTWKMKIVAAQSDLNLALKQLSSKIVVKKVSHPSLADLAIYVGEGSITLRAVSIGPDRELTVKVPAVIEGEGVEAICLPASTLADAVSNANKKEAVSMSYDSQSHVLTVEGTHSKVKSVLATKPESDIKDISIFKDSVESQSLKVPSDILHKVIAGTAFAASTDPYKQILTGVNFQIAGNTLRAAGTNGHILPSVVVEDAVESDVSELEFTAPAKLLIEIAKVLKGKGSSPVTTVTSYPKCIEIGFTVGKAEFNYRMTPVEGQYPNYSQLVPDTFRHTYEIDPNQFAPIVQQAGKVAKGWNNVAKLSFGDGSITVTASNGPGGEDAVKFESSVPANGPGAKFEIAFNATYILDGLKAISTFSKDATVKLMANSPTTPAVFEPANQPEGAQVRYLIMPAQIRS